MYSFKDVRKASMEESDYLARAKASKTFDTKKYGQKHPVFGLLVLESDQDLDPKTAYLFWHKEHPKIVTKYHGNMQMYYSQESLTFHTVITLKQ